MATFACPKCGAQSTDSAFCSDCGASMQAVVPAPATGPAAAPGDANAPDETCPSCGEARPGPDARFCENCRYDFLARQPFSVAANMAAGPLHTEAQPTPPAVPLPPPAPPSAPPPVVQHWDVRAEVDLSWRRPDDPMPADQRVRIFPLDLSNHLVGRRSDEEGIHPEIALTDPGISRRHARIARAPDGALTLIAFGSLNGTKLNGAEIEPHVPMPLADGDVITIGIWTRLVVTAR